MMHAPWRYLPAVLWKRRPLHLTLFVTRRCNAHCPYCFYLAAAGCEPAPAPELSLDEYERLAPTVGPLLWLAFSGGEPVLRRDLPDIAAVFARHCRPCFLTLPTNGLLPAATAAMAERILAACPRSTVVVKVSIDGVGDGHDALRGVPGAYDKAIASCRLLADLAHRQPRLQLGVNTVLTAVNHETVGRLVDEVAAMEGVGGHTISLVRGRLAQPRYLDVPPQAFREVQDHLHRPGKARRYSFVGGRLKAAEERMRAELVAEIAATGCSPLPCHAGRLSIVLSETGEVFSCEMIDQSFGNLRDYGYDLRRVLVSERARKGLRRIDAGCACTHECALMLNILFSPAAYPRLLRRLMKA